MTHAATEQLLAEYQSLTVDCGSAALDDWTTISITGDDRISFIQNMGTNDLRRLVAGNGCETFFTDVKGKIVAHAFALVTEEELLLLTVPDQAATILGHLDRYVIREDVCIQDKSDDWKWLVLSGAKASERLEALTNFDAAKLKGPWQHTECRVGANKILVVRCRELWPESFLIRYSSSEESELQELLDRPCGESSWTVLRVESGLPLLGIDFDETNLPQEVNRNEQAINFNKGCYLGQETIARIDALGHVNQQIVSLLFPGEEVPPAGSKLVAEGKEVGEVTSSCWSPRQNAPLALAMVRRGSNTQGSLLQSQFGDATVL